MLRPVRGGSICALALAVAAMGAGCDDQSVTPDGARGMDARTGVDACCGMSCCDAPPDGMDAAMTGMDSGDSAGTADCVGAFPALTVVDVAPGASWTAPVFLTQPPGESEALYVVEQSGLIRVVRPAGVSTFLDLTSRVDFAQHGGIPSERGLLGLAFHPQYATNGRFFVYYTATVGAGDLRNIVAEYHRDMGNTEVRRLVDAADPDTNHNGGMIAFGPDGRLYVGIGDGGGANDEYNNGQNTNTLFGSLLRLDVDNTAGDYAAAGNPFAAGGGLPQIWSYGLRNPWRFSFDRLTGDLFLGDVGQDAFEEIDFQPASSTGGENYGWPAYEGFERLREDVAAPANHTPPILVYAHNGDAGDVITGFVGAAIGGYVYRGSIAALRGWYFFSDAYNEQIAAFRYCNGQVVGARVVSDISGVVAPLFSFGEDQAGELYILGGGVVRIVER